MYKEAMPDRSKKRKFSIMDLLSILVVILLIYILYLLVGGNWTALTRLGSNSGGESPLDQIVGSLSAIGQGIGNAFSGMFR
jgi:hypothetical protein